MPLLPFRRSAGPPRDPLAVSMSGVQRGERLLQIGVDDPALIGALSAKVGMSGHAAVAVSGERDADRARGGAAQAGSLVEVHVLALDALSFEPSSFDVVVIHSRSGMLGSLTDDDRRRALGEAHRVLREGGRVVVIEAGPHEGLKALFASKPVVNEAYANAGGAVTALELAGFRPVRLLAERDGYRFVEGLKTSA